MSAMSETDVNGHILEFIRVRFLAGDPSHELDAETELLALGILDSLNTAILVSFINDEIGVQVPIEDMSAHNFATVSAIGRLVSGLAARSSS